MQLTLFEIDGDPAVYFNGDPEDYALLDDPTAWDFEGGQEVLKKLAFVVECQGYAKKDPGCLVAATWLKIAETKLTEAA